MQIILDFAGYYGLGLDNKPCQRYNTSTVKEVVKWIDTRHHPASPILIIIVIYLFIIRVLLEAILSQR